MRPPPLCPRCGYDLSGAVATWEDRCPLEGVCSECGLALRWVEAYFPDRERVRGLYEHAEGFVRSLWWSVRTMWLVALPWRFWGRVTMAMTPRNWRALAGLAVVSALLWVAGSIASHAAYYLAQVVAGPGGTPVYGPLAAVLNGWTQPLFLMSEMEPGLAPLGYPFWIGRPCLWPFVPVAVLPAVASWPLVFLLLRDSRQAANVRWSHLLRATVYSLWVIPGLALWRLVHVAGWCAVLAPPALSPTGIAGVGAPMPASPWSWIPPDEGQPETVAVLLAIGWIQWWWLFAITRGFRLHMGWGLWALLAIISVLIVPFTWVMVAVVVGVIRTFTG